MKRILVNLRFKTEQSFYWTDSSIVLAWIGSSSRKWHMFVANRVSEIHNNSSLWRHVGSKDNLADLASRGTTPDQLMKSEIWWHEPQWLKQDSELWPSGGEKLLKDIPEQRKQTEIAAATNGEAIIEFKRFSSSYKLLRVIAYVLRFIHVTKRDKENRG